MNFFQWLSVFSLSSLKILPAVGLSIAYKMAPWEIFLCVSGGGILGVAIFARIGEWLRARRKARRRLKHDPRRIRKAFRIVRIWRRFGIYGIALLTPPILSPPIGTIIAVAFGERFGRIMLYMSISTVFWAGMFALLGKQLIRYLP